MPYNYRPLREREGGDAIRLLHIYANKNNDAPIECGLLDYFLPDPDTGDHLYEALSYVWGSTSEEYKIWIDGCPFVVTDNLHAALLRLRNRYLDRIVWIDAICINQSDLEERAKQIRSMARIYGRARNVVVWLGESEDGSDEVIEEIRRVASDKTASRATSEVLRGELYQLLRRPWFKRVWVLQEAAASRQTHIICGKAQIDGHSFFQGVKRLNIHDGDVRSPGTSIISVCNLLFQANARPNHASWWTGRRSLGIGCLAGLLDMYHAHQATERHDKIFALLGMCTDDLSIAALSANYRLSWSETFKRSFQVIFGPDSQIEVLGDGEVAVVERRGHVFGKIISVQSSVMHETGQQVSVRYWTKSEQRVLWYECSLTMRVTAKPIKVGDLLCSLDNLRGHSVVRPLKDYFLLICIDASLYLMGDMDRITKGPKERQDIESQKLKHSLMPLNDFLLVWEWDADEETSKHQSFHELETSWGHNRTSSFEKAERLATMALVTAETSGHLYGERLIKAAKRSCKALAGNSHESVWKCRHALALMRWLDHHEKRVHYAYNLLESTIDCLGSSHRDTIRFISMLEALAEANWKEEQPYVRPIRALVDLMEAKKDDGLSDEQASFFVQHSDALLLKYLLDTRGDKFHVTENVLLSAVSNALKTRAQEILTLFLDTRKSECKITERVFEAALHQSLDFLTMYRLLTEKPHNFTVTDQIVMAAIENNSSFMLHPLLDRVDKGFELSEDVPIIAASHGSLLQVIIHSRGHNVKITEAILKSLVNSSVNNESQLSYVYGMRKDEIIVTEEVLICAMTGQNGGHSLDVFSRFAKSNLPITSRVVEAAATFKHNDSGMSLLLLREDSRGLITQNMFKAAVAHRNCEPETVMRFFKIPHIQMTQEIMETVPLDQPKRGALIMSMFLEWLQEREPLLSDLSPAIPECWKTQAKIATFMLEELRIQRKESMGTEEAGSWTRALETVQARERREAQRKYFPQPKPAQSYNIFGSQPEDLESD